MANREHVDRLWGGVDSWNGWRRSRSQPFRADLSGADLRAADLRAADLRDADLSRADLSGADLRAADLRDADLRAADLSRADLSGADLRDADLSGADLRAANLRDADLRDADLIGANLIGAGLENADVTNASFGWTVFANVDLSALRGLERGNFVAPSTIGIDTLLASEGKIPDVFLRGCGVPPEFIPYAKDLATPFAFKFYSAFLSHSSTDKTFVNRLHDSLFNENKVSCWLDEHQLLPGDDLQKGITEGIRKTDRMILVCSADSLGSWWVNEEVERALAKERKFHRQGREVSVLIPVSIDGALFEEGVCTHPWVDTLRSRIAADFSDADNYERQLGRLVEALRVAGPLGRPRMPPVIDDPNAS